MMTRRIYWTWTTSWSTGFVAQWRGRFRCFQGEVSLLSVVEGATFSVAEGATFVSPLSEGDSRLRGGTTQPLCAPQLTLSLAWLPPPPTRVQGCKNFLGCRKGCNSNVILYPGLPGRSAGGRKCQTDDNGEFAEQFHENNVCATPDGDFYSFSRCNTTNLATTVYVTKNNTLFADSGASAWAKTCGSASFEEWQALGQDAQSTTAVTPSVAELIALGAAKTLQRS